MLFFLLHHEEIFHPDARLGILVPQEKMSALEAQVKHLGFQAARDCERLTKDKTLTLQLLHKVGVPEDCVIYRRC